MAVSTICQSWGVSFGQVLCRSGMAGSGQEKAAGVAAAVGVGAGVGAGVLAAAGLLLELHAATAIAPSTTTATAGLIFTYRPPGK